MQIVFKSLGDILRGLRNKENDMDEQIAGMHTRAKEIGPALQGCRLFVGKMILANDSLVGLFDMTAPFPGKLALQTRHAELRRDLLAVLRRLTIFQEKHVENPSEHKWYERMDQFAETVEEVTEKFHQLSTQVARAIKESGSPREGYDPLF
jgi:hypothetical protein